MEARRGRENTSTKSSVQKRRVDVKREKVITRTEEEQAKWDVDKAELMYDFLVDDNPICLRHGDAKNNLINAFIMLEMGRPVITDIKSIKLALSIFGVLDKV